MAPVETESGSTGHDIKIRAPLANKRIVYVILSRVIGRQFTTDIRVDVTRSAPPKSVLDEKADGVLNYRPGEHRTGRLAVRLCVRPNGSLARELTRAIGACNQLRAFDPR